MKRFKVELHGTASMFRTTLVEANTEKEARTRARALAKGDAEPTLSENVGTWELNSPPKTIHTGEVMIAD